MEPKLFVLGLFLVIFFVLGVAKCEVMTEEKEEEEEEKDSEEFKRTVDAVYITPDDLLQTHSVSDGCMMTCNGSDINWRSPNGTLVDSKRGRVHVEDMSSWGSQTQVLRLVFEEIAEVDNGEWTCVGNYDEKSFNMFVYVPIEFVPVHTLVSVNEHESVKLPCAARGNPAPALHWDFKGTKISNVEESLSSHFINMTDGLFIKNARRQHSGEYACKAIQMTKTSIIEMKELAIQLTVQFKPEISKSRLNGKINGSSSLTYVKYATVNSTESLVCEAEGNPPPTFLWYHNGKKMSHHHINSTDSRSTLTVNFHSNKTFGDYKCIARNIVGQADMRVKIVEGRRPEKPQRLKMVGQSERVLDIDVGSKKTNLEQDPLAITHYRFEILLKDEFDRNDGEWKNPFIKDKKAESNVTYTIVDLKPATTYLVRVAAINAVGLSDWTVIKDFKTLDAAPLKTTGGGGGTKASSFYIFYLIIVTVVLVAIQ